MRIFQVLLLSLFFLAPVKAQFQKIDIEKISKADAREVEFLQHSQFQNPQDFQIYKTEIPSELLQKSVGTRNIQLVDHKDIEHEYEIVEVQNMMPGLQKKFPNIRSYRGYSKKNPAQRISITTDGEFLYARSQGLKENFFIQPIWKTDAVHAISSVDKASMRDSEITCLFDDRNIRIDPKGEKTHAKSGNAMVSLKTYRVAIATTGEFSAQTGGNVESVLTSINNHLNLVNEVFEREIGAKHLLIAQNDQLIFLDPVSDPYDNSDKSSMLVANTNVINGIVGGDAYDFGHVFGQGGGGVANLQVPCSGRKARGVSGLGGNASFFKLVAHEIGHQFGAGHTWNYCSPALNSGQRSSASAAEPGSGSTLMSYAGLCPGQNVQGDDDPYYHAISVEQIKTFIDNGGGKACATVVPTTNNEPIIQFDYENGFFIPVSTPFQLRGSATDEDGDQLTYNIDQYNFGPVNPLGEVTGDAPSFRSFEPDSIPERIFPALSSILSGTSSSSEILPDYERNFSFRFLVRDNNTESGSIVWEDVNFASNLKAGPFKVLENGSLDMLAGVSQPVHWDVASTNNPIIDCQLVNILLSFDGGMTFMDTLAVSTANDGFEFVDFPSQTSNNARIKIEAADNIFFDISDEKFNIIDPTLPDFSLDLDITSNNLCRTDQADYVISNIPYLGFTQPINLSVTAGLPVGAAANFSINPVAVLGNSTLTINNLVNVVPGNYNITVQATVPGGSTKEFDVLLSLIDGILDMPILDVPQDGKFLVPINVNSEWQSVNNAVNYQYQLATDVQFQNIVLDSSGIIIPNIPLNNLDQDELYFWRIKAFNQCGESEYGEVSAFYTKNQFCNRYSRHDPAEIKDDAPDQVSSSINIDSTFTIGEFRIPYIRGTHDFIGDLNIFIQPAVGNRLTLINQICDDSQDFDIGFDNEAIAAPICPINTGEIFKPQNSLNSLSGKAGKGLYILFIKDENAGSGGEFQEWAIEFCQEFNPNKPTIENNIGLTLKTSATKVISNSDLSTVDLDSNDDELLYVLMSVPQKGNLLINQNVAELGSTFTQADIANSLLAYQHTGTEIEDTDSLAFIVTDQAGGLIKRTTFNITITESTSVFKILDANLFTIYPNPGNGIFNISIAEDNLSFDRLSLFNLNGQILLSQSINPSTSSELQIDISNLQTGIYQLTLFGKNSVLTKKLVIQKMK